MNRLKIYLYQLSNNRWFVFLTSYPYLYELIWSRPDTSMKIGHDSFVDIQRRTRSSTWREKWSFLQLIRLQNCLLILIAETYPNFFGVLCKDLKFLQVPTETYFVFVSCMFLRRFLMSILQDIVAFHRNFQLLSYVHRLLFSLHLPDW